MGSRYGRPAILLAALLTAVVLSACSEDDGAGPVTETSASSGRHAAGLDLPPESFEDLQRTFAPRFDALGMTLTRASVVELDTGPHIQLYVEPPGPLSTEEYVTNIVPTTAAVVPFIFDEWADLASFDVCQEPPPGVDDSVSPEQVTVVALTRQQAADLAWPEPELADLMGAVRGATSGEVRGNDEVEAFPAFREARAAAG